MPIPKCNVCKKEAEVVDTEYGEYYCHYHANMFEVFKGPHRNVEEELDGNV